MFSALKRLVNNDNTSSNQVPSGQTQGSNSAVPNTNPPTNAKSNSQPSLPQSQQQQQQQLQNVNGMQAVSQALQKKFARGVNYNMKIVIRGDNNTGKSCLFERLQGKDFKETYEPSDEIRVANIHWNYKLCENDVVKVEVWDVVDKSKKKRQLVPSNSVLKTENKNSSQKDLALNVEPSLDAEFIDVYKNANGCIMCYDMTKTWTWDYIERELPKVPSHIPVLILGNHKDMDHHRAISEMKCRYFIENLNRGGLGSIVRYAECSMRNGFGLSYLYKFLNIPFLQLQRETIMQQLEVNAKELDIVSEELGYFEQNLDNEYEQFTDKLNNKRRTQSEQQAADVLKNAKTIEQAKKEAQEREEARKAAEEASASDGKKIINNIIQKVTPIIPKSQSLNVIENKNANKISPPKAETKTKMSKNKNVLEEILPEAVDEFNRFLDDAKHGSSSAADASMMNLANEDDDDDDGNLRGNPMVANFKDTYDSSDLSDNDAAKSKNVNMNKNNRNMLVKNADNDSDSEVDEKMTVTNTHLDKKLNSMKLEKENDFVLINDSSNKLEISSRSSSNGSEYKNGQRAVSFNDDNQSIPSINIEKVDYPLDMKTAKSAEANLKLTTDDFEFLEKLGTASITATSSLTTSLVAKKDEITDDSESLSSRKKEKSKKKSKDSDTETKKKKKSSKKTSKKDSDDEQESKSKKKSKEKRRSKKQEQNVSDDDDGDNAQFQVKADLDYEEL